MGSLATNFSYLPGGTALMQSGGGATYGAAAPTTANPAAFNPDFFSRLFAKREAQRDEDRAAAAAARNLQMDAARDAQRRQARADAASMNPADRVDWYTLQGAARRPVTGFNMGGGYTIDPNALPPEMRPASTQVIPGSAVPTGSMMEDPRAYTQAGRDERNKIPEDAGYEGPINEKVMLTNAYRRSEAGITQRQEQEAKDQDAKRQMAMDRQRALLGLLTGGTVQAAR